MLELSFKLIIVSVLSVAAIDVWQRLFYMLGGLPPTNWKLIGRWLLVLLREHIVLNKSLSNTPAITGEAAAGWGCVCVGLLRAVETRQPTLPNA
jgi:hypothetical protein